MGGLSLATKPSLVAYSQIAFVSGRIKKHFSTSTVTSIQVWKNPTTNGAKKKRQHILLTLYQKEGYRTTTACLVAGCDVNFTRVRV